MKLIDADNITLYYGGLVYIGAYDFYGIGQYFGKQIKAQDEVKAIPCDFIYRMINEPNNAGMKSFVLKWLLQEWEKEGEQHK